MRTKVGRKMDPNRNSISWNMVEGEISTRWASKISPESVLPEYPRPQLKRTEWKNLNGLWKYAILPKQTKRVNSFDGDILVPFPVESALSGVKRSLKSKQKLWYQRKFEIPKEWVRKRVLLHFGAVDSEATVWVNDKEVGSHKGGNTPFSFDITDKVNKNLENEIIVSVWDPTDKGGVERGKQTLKPYGIKYTAMSGIWQTVWIEPVPETYVKSLKIITDIDKELMKMSINLVKIQSDDKVVFSILEKNKEIGKFVKDVSGTYEIKIPTPKLWAPNDPFLYDLKITLERDGKMIDEVSSYFGMRKISVGTDEKGFKRLMLNNKELFQLGPLDQGYWPDGLYTAPTDEALKFDIEIAKELGFNTIRKHVKVEPERWYYHCDKLGVLVWQDKVPGGNMNLLAAIKGILARKKQKEVYRPEEQKRQYYKELEEMITTLYNHPSIIMWVPFNEGWGQFDTVNVVNKVKELDPYRLVNNASGWHDFGIGDVADCHKYIGPGIPENIKGRVAVCGEFGGLGLYVKEHMWQKKFRFVYKKFDTAEQVLKTYGDLISKLKEMKKKGLSAGIYTQITDVEGELNGLLTYDREVVKIDKSQVKEWNSSAYE